MILALAWATLVAPGLWLARSLVALFGALLALTIAWRFYRITLARLAPHWPWPLAGNKLRPVRATQAILITGATSGIGLALAKHLYRAGYSVLAAYYDPGEAGHAELERLAAAHGGQQQQRQQRQQQEQQPQQQRHGPANRLFLVELDVRDEKSIARAYERTAALLAEHQLELYSLINNAGLGSLQPFAWLQRSAIRNLIETNLVGNLLMAREFMPLLVGARGRLLFVSSGLGMVPGATYATYGLTKCAQIHLARCLNLELRQRYGVQCIAMVPHNFIKNTNICSLNVRNNELAWQELKPIERDYYRAEFEEHGRLVKSLDEATKELLRKTATDHKLQQKEPANGGGGANTGAGARGPRAAIRRFLKPLRTFYASLSGQNLAGTLEESGILESFEDALRLESPPEVMFAGNATFQLLIGSLLLSLPASCAGLLSSSVAPSLYR